MSGRSVPERAEHRPAIEVDAEVETGIDEMFARSPDDEPRRQRPVEMDAWAGLDAVPILWPARFVSACCGAVVVGGFWRFGFDSGASWAVAFGAAFVAAAVWIITLARG